MNTRPIPERTVQLLDLAPILNALAETTASSVVSLGVNYEHLAIALHPSREVEPARLRLLLEQSGLYPELFRQMQPAKGYVFTSGMFGACSTTIFPTKRGPRWMAARREDTLDERPWRLLTILFEHLAVPVDVSLYSLLPYFLNVPTLINGFEVQAAVTTSLSPDRQREPVYFRWEVDGAAGAIYHNDQIPFGVVIQGQQYRPLERWPNFVLLVEQGDLLGDDLDRWLLKIATHLRRTLFAAEFGENQALSREQLQAACRDEGLKRMLATDAAADLLKLLGFGFREQFRNLNVNYADGLETATTRIVANPIILGGLTRASVALLPEEVVLVGKDEVYGDQSSVLAQIRASRPLGEEAGSPMRVQIVDEITAGSIPLPYLYVERGECWLNDELVSNEGTPTLYVAQGADSYLEVFLKLATNPLLLEGILANLYVAGVDIWEEFLDAIPHEQTTSDFDFDRELCALELLSRSEQANEEEKAFIRLAARWLYDTSLLVAYEARAVEDLVCKAAGCDHQHPEACIERARNAVIGFLLDPETAKRSPLDYMQYFRPPIYWRVDDGFDKCRGKTPSGPQADEYLEDVCA